MMLLRALVFNIAFYLWTALLGLYATPVLLAPRRVNARFGRFWSAGSLRLLDWIVGCTYETRGLAYLPREPSIIAMKHQSAWDTLVLPLIFDDPAVVIKSELVMVPIYGWYAIRAGSIALDRKAGATSLKRLLKQARAAAQRGRSIAIFPEGTRRAVDVRLPYHPGVAALYSQLGLPIVPVAVNSGFFWGRRAFLKRPGRIIVEILPPIAPGLDRREMMARLEGTIEDATARLVAEARRAAAARQQ